MGRGPGVSKTEEVGAEAGWKKRPGYRAGEWTGQTAGRSAHRVTFPRKARPCPAAAVSVGRSL